MFNKEESRKNVKCKIIHKTTVKRIGTAILTMTLIGSLKNAQAVDLDYHTKMYDYYERVEEYLNEREYDGDFFKIYYTGRFIIDGIEIKNDRIFIVAGYIDNQLHFSLYTSVIGKKDILTGTDIDYEKPVLIPFVDTTLFKTLLDNNLIIVKDGRYMSFDMERTDEIIEELYNWDGMAHSLVPETDAMENKEYIEREKSKEYEKK